MKFLKLFILLIFLNPFYVSAQQDKNIEDNKVYSFVQEKASPQEGLKMFHQNFKNKFDLYASLPEQNDVKFLLKFVVEKDGSLSNITVEGTDDFYAKEAIRVLKTFDKWIPAQDNNLIVRSKFTLPITIYLPDELIPELGYVMARPEDGLSSFMDKFGEEFKFPNDLIAKSEIGSFTMNFTVEEDGSLTNIIVTEDKFNIGADVERVIKLMPKWKSATKNNKNIKSQYSMPVEINLEKKQNRIRKLFKKKSFLVYC